MSVFRINKTKDYTIMSNSHLKEKEMSLKGKGLLSVMLSLPDSWDYSINGLVAISKENQTAIENTLKELKAFGYLRVDKIMPDKSKSGRIEYVYNIFETPQKQEDKKQGVENLPLEIQGVENRPQLNTNQSSTKESNIKNKDGLLFDKLKQNIQSEKVVAALKDWLEYKKEKHQTYTEKGLRILVEKLRKDTEHYGEQYVVDSINHSMSNMYSGIYPQPNGKEQKTNKKDFMHHEYTPENLKQIIEHETPLEEIVF